MTQFATGLSLLVHRVVVDQTGLVGLGAPALPPIDPNGPSIFTALQEQLGLTLNSQRGLVDVLVIDRVEQPTEN
jgi:hypothetical protein